MAKSSHKCPKCSRKFSMAAHLARHVNSMHKRGGSTAAKRKSGKRLGRPPAALSTMAPRRGRPPAVASGGAAGLLNGLRNYHTDLMAQRDSLEMEMDALGRAISAMGGVATSAPRAALRGRSAKTGPVRRGVRSGSLTDVVGKVLAASSSAIGPKEIAARVVKMGYRSRAADLTKAVSNALPKIKGLKRVGFGLYQA